MKCTTPRPQLSAAPCCSGGLRVRRASGPRSDRYPQGRENNCHLSGIWQQIGYRKNLVDMISAGYLNTLLEEVAW